MDDLTHRPWWQRLREADPVFYGRLFADSTPEDFLARVAKQQERYGIPAKCEHVPTLLAVAKIVST